MGCKLGSISIKYVRELFLSFRKCGIFCKGKYFCCLSSDEVRFIFVKYIWDKWKFLQEQREQITLNLFSCLFQMSCCWYFCLITKFASVQRKICFSFLLPLQLNLGSFFWWGGSVFFFLSSGKFYLFFFFLRVGKKILPVFYFFFFLHRAGKEILPVSCFIFFTWDIILPFLFFYHS